MKCTIPTLPVARNESINRSENAYGMPVRARVCASPHASVRTYPRHPHSLHTLPPRAKDRID